jgi:methionine sulfoxide reductase catalytic subunit
MGLGALAFGLGLGSGSRSVLAATPADPSAGLYPAARNEKFTVTRPITEEATASTYNNFYEFGSQKEIWRAAAKLPLRPWTVHLDGLVEAPREIGIDDLLKAMSLEERVVRHRCVEAWSMTVPWTGFPLKDLVALAKPLSSAKYVRFETFQDDSVASGQLQSWYPWPYVEALTMAEATNELAFMVTGAYGKPAAPQFGAPLRLHTPWKFGFKSIKSVVRLTFTEERPVSFWEKTGPDEYGFWANVNPEVPHPRWSQATERVLGTGERVPTALFNGYGAFVADLYKDMDGLGKKLWM